MTYKIKVEERHEFDISREDLEMLDIISTSRNIFNLIYKNKSHKIEVIDISPVDKYITLLIDEMEYKVEINDELDQLISELGLDVIEVANGQVLHSPMPGLVLSLDVKEGDVVEEGDQLLVLEAMKMENVIKATSSGIVSAIHITPSEAVSKGQLLIEISNGE